MQARLLQALSDNIELASRQQATPQVSQTQSDVRSSGRSWLRKWLAIALCRELTATVMMTLHIRLKQSALHIAHATAMAHVICLSHSLLFRS